MATSFKIIKRCLSTSSSVCNIFKHVTVVGGGLMGSGIAQVTAQSGIDVTIVEVSEEAAKKCENNIKTSIQRVAKKLFQNQQEDADKYISESIGRLKITLDLKEAVSKTDLVIEAIVENMAAKHKLFSSIDVIAPEHTIFASNTSSLPIKEIASVTKRKDRFGGLHFFNPVPVMKLLEVVRTAETSENTYQKMMAWGKAIGKTTVSCKDTPGFVVNRLLIPYLAEAARMLERGDASAKDIDIAMKLGAGYPMGPLELLDYVGLDTTKFILDGWHQKCPENLLYKPINLLNKLVSEGKLGKKTGEGFYVYKKKMEFFPPPHHAHYSHSSTTTPAKRESFQNTQNFQNAQNIQNTQPVLYKEKEPEIPKRRNFDHIIFQVDKNNKVENLIYKKKDKWKTSEEILKDKKEKIIANIKKPGARLYRWFDNCTAEEIFRTQEKSRNQKDFLKFERKH